MTRRHEDYDEFCDPDKPRLIKYEQVVDAMNNIRPKIPITPCIASHYRKEFAMNLYYKLEMLQKTGSFKERGALNALKLLPLDKKKCGVIIASNGNSAAGFCYHGSCLGIPVTVVMSNNVPINKLQLCSNLGAKVIVQGGNLMDCQRFARTMARERGLAFIHSRDHPNILAGYGTVALEVLEQVPHVDAIVVPVGMGGLAAAVATVIKHIRPQCLVYGVQTENVPAFFKSLEVDEPIMITGQSSIADSIAISTVGVNAFYNAKPKLDKMLLVNEDWIARAILHLVEKERFIVEGAGACTLAAIIGHLVPEFKTKTVVCILSGGNIDTIMLGRCMDRGMAAEGRLVKFKVSLKDKPSEITQLMNLIASGGYNVIRQFADHIWSDSNVYTLEMKLVCETTGLDHALELKRIVERAYPCSAIFETEPFNDKRTCPCFVRKSI